MNDPYSVLGVSPNASDAEIKRAYRELARKYHPDNYHDNPLADLAEEKMKAINAAYDAIQRDRAGATDFSTSTGTGSSYQHYQQYQQTHQQFYQQQYQYDARQSTFDSGNLYAHVRQLINLGNLAQAEQLLRGAPRQDAEWHFLSGHIAYQKGWLDEAVQHFRMACSMQPGNAEYRQTLSMLQQNTTGYRPSDYRYTGCDPCTTCMCISCVSPCC